LKRLSAVAHLQEEYRAHRNGAAGKTTFLLVNTGTVAAQFTLDFFGDAGTPVCFRWTRAALASTLTDTIPAGACA